MLGAPASLALNSCTAGLHLALVASGVRTGDEVITTPMTFAASVNVIEHVGARPVLVDVEPDTLNLDPVRVEEAVTDRTRAIIAVHFAGHPVDLDPLRRLAASNGLVLIEDAAHALPATYRDQYIGGSQNPVAFSFYATKNLTTAEGGMLTGDRDFIDRCRTLSLHGMNRDAWKRYDQAGSWFYEIREPGFKYNMNDIQASLGLWQLRKLAGFQKRRRAIAARYFSAFSDLDAFVLPTVSEHVDPAWHLYAVRLRSDRWSIGRDMFVEELKARNIGTSVHFIPIHLHPFYRDKYGYRPGDFPVAYDAFERTFSLPINPRMCDVDVEDVIAAVLDVARTFRRA